MVQVASKALGVGPGRSTPAPAVAWPCCLGADAVGASCRTSPEDGGMDRCARWIGRQMGNEHRLPKLGSKSLVQ